MRNPHATWGNIREQLNNWVGHPKVDKLIDRLGEISLEIPVIEFGEIQDLGSIFAVGFAHERRTISEMFSDPALIARDITESEDKANKEKENNLDYLIGEIYSVSQRIEQYGGRKQIGVAISMQQFTTFPQRYFKKLFEKAFLDLIDDSENKLNNLRTLWVYLVSKINPDDFANLEKLSTPFSFGMSARELKMNKENL